MPYRIDLPPKVRKILDRLDSRTFLKLDREIVALQNEPRPFGCKKLEGPIHRIRIGDWRVIYAVYDDLQLVQLINVVRRSERTYRRY